MSFAFHLFKTLTTNEAVYNSVRPDPCITMLGHWSTPCISASGTSALLSFSSSSSNDSLQITFSKQQSSCMPSTYCWSTFAQCCLTLFGTTINSGMKKQCFSEFKRGQKKSSQQNSLALHTLTSDNGSHSSLRRNSRLNQGPAINLAAVLCRRQLQQQKL